MVVAGPMVQPEPIAVSPRSVVAEAIVVSAPMVTPASTQMLSGATKVTPAWAWASRIWRWASISTVTRSARSFTPIALRTSSVTCEATVRPCSRSTVSAPGR